MKTTVNCTVFECQYNDNGRCNAEAIYVEDGGCWTCIVPGEVEEVEDDS